MDQRRIFSPSTRGLYVVVPAEYRSWGVVSAMWFIDPTMRHLGRQYYVGLLSTAQVHGAAHQRPQVSQVITDRPVRDRDFERVQLRMYAKRTINPAGVQRVNTHTGTAAVSSPELTVIDMSARLEHVGGLDNLATVIEELASDGLLDARRFAPSRPPSRPQACDAPAGSSSTSAKFVSTRRRNATRRRSRSTSTRSVNGEVTWTVAGEFGSTRRRSPKHDSERRHHRLTPHGVRDNAKRRLRVR
jgi:hypothetical protein